MSTLSTTNLRNPSAPGNNIILNADGTISGSALATTSDVNGVTTTGTNTAGSTSLTVGSAAGIVAGMFIVGEGIAPSTTVSTIVGTTVTMSQASAASPNLGLTGTEPVTFYSATKVLSPGVVGSQLCRAWVNFDGTGTVAIRAAYNVSSITDNGTGDYTVNFATALVDANYSAVVSTGGASGGNVIHAPHATAPSPVTTTAYRLISYTYVNGGTIDMPYVCVAIFR